MGQVLDGAGRRLKVWERYPNPLNRLYETLLLKKLLSKMSSKQNRQRPSFSFRKTANHKTA